MKWIVCKNLKKIYRVGKKEIFAINGISFEIDKNETVGILGPNGAGKTTLIKCLCGLIIPTSGEVFIKSYRVTPYSSFQFEHISAVLEGNRNIFWRLSVKENLEMFVGLRGHSFKFFKKRAEELLDLFHLSDKADTEARFLSRGMQQKLAIACALIKNTDILFFDEPTLGLDVEMLQHLKQLFSQKELFKNKAVLISSHNMNFIESVCNRVLIINKGNIMVDKSVTELKEFFKVREYEFIVEGIISNVIIKNLKLKFPGLKIEESLQNKMLKFF